MSTVLITAAGDDVRGRVLGLYYATMGLSALGWLGIGAVATLLGAPVALTLSGSIVALGALGLLSRRQGLSRPGAAISGPE